MVRTRQIGKTFEKKWAKKTGSKVTIGSGNLWFDKEDCKNAKWIFQNKATTKDYYNLRLVDLIKLQTSASKTNRKWAFAIEFSCTVYEERTCFVVFPVKYLLTVLQKPVQECEYLGTFEKQVKLRKETLENIWLSEKPIGLVMFNKFGELLLIMNELDFLKEFQGELQ